MNEKITVEFTWRQWQEVLYAIMEAEEAKKNNSNIYAILLRAEQAMRIGKDKKEDEAED